jgi:hypothetical protein
MKATLSGKRRGLCVDAHRADICHPGVIIDAK